MGANNAPKNNVFYRNQGWSYPRIVKGEGIYLWDENGKRYLDSCAGAVIANIGHGNKEIAAYAKERIETIAFTHLSRWTVDTIEKCCEKLASWCPSTLNHVFLLSGGSEAVDAAIKMSRQFFVERDGKTSKYKVISKWNAFHGNTLGSLSCSGLTGGRKIFDPLLLPFPKTQQFYHYRNPWGCASMRETSIKCAEALEEEIKRHGADNIMAFISEPVIGTAIPGCTPDPIYFQMVREICDRYDILWIDDEVMAGMGRTGKKMAVEHFGVVQPDLIVTAKGMSAGYTPIGSVVASDRVFETIMINGSGVLNHGHTYAGNPLSAGIAWKVMDIVERENLIANVAVHGEYLLGRMQELYKYPIVGEVRGKGLLCGIEFVKDQATKEPFPAADNIKGKFTKATLDVGIVAYPGGGSVDGVRGDCTIVSPPFIITKDQVDELMECLHKSVKAVCDTL